jgi:hypothetical protein
MPDTVELLARAKLAAEEARACDSSEAGARAPPSLKTLEEAVREQRRRVPLGELLSRHALPLLLQILVTTCGAAAFYSYTAWLPQHVAALGVPLITSQVRAGGPPAPVSAALRRPAKRRAKGAVWPCRRSVVQAAASTNPAWTTTRPHVRRRCWRRRRLS